jgi:hypothetical protein
MFNSAKKPCCICRRWFRPDVRVGSRQRACGQPECQAALRIKTQASWRSRNPGYAPAWRIQSRSESKPPPKPIPLPAPLSNLPWDMAKEEFGIKGADFVAIMGGLLLRSIKDQIERQGVDLSGDPGTLPPIAAKDEIRTQLIDSA